MALELIARLRRDLGQQRLDVCGDDLLGLRVEIVEIISLGGKLIDVLVIDVHAERWRRCRVESVVGASGLWNHEQAIVEADLGLPRVPDRQPVNVTFDLACLRSRCTAAGLRIVGTVDRGHLATLVLVDAHPFDHEGIAQPYLLAGRETKVTLRRLFAEIVALDPELTRKGDRARAQLGLLRMVGQEALFFLAGGIVVDDQLDRVKHRDTTLGARVQIIAQTVFQHAHVDPLIGLGHADALGEQTKTFRREAAAARADERGHPRIVPSIDVATLHQFEEHAFAHHRIQEIQPCKFILLRQRTLQKARLRQALDHPVIERPVVLELERAKRMRDALQRVGNAVRVVVERIDAPFVAGAVMRDVAYAVDRRVAQIDVRACQIDLESQNVRAIRKLALLHPPEEIEIFFHRAVAKATGAARFGERAPKMAHLLGRRAVDVGQIRLDQVPRKLVQAVEIVGSVIEMRPPVVSQPFHRGFDRILVFDVFLDRVGIVKAQMTDTAVFAGQAEVQADGFGVTYMQVTVGLGREAGHHAAAILAGALILGHDLPKEIRGHRCGRIMWRCNTHRLCS